MGTITRSFANNITTSGVLLPASLTNNSIANVTAYNASVATVGMVLISSQTASNSASISFTTGINSTYKEYQFYFIDIHGRTNSAEFQFNLSTDSGSNYNVTKTTTYFRTFHYENASDFALGYNTGYDLAQSTDFQNLNGALLDTADASCSGYMSLFNPSSTTYVKHFMSNINNNGDSSGNYSWNAYMAGYGNTTSAINAIQFKPSSGNFDGTILMFGIV
jgi:hypothetical protein